MEEVKGVGQIFMECLDEQTLLKRVMAEVILPKLDEIVAKSETKIDDAVLALAKDLLGKI